MSHKNQTINVTITEKDRDRLKKISGKYFNNAGLGRVCRILLDHKLRALGEKPLDLILSHGGKRSNTGNRWRYKGDDSDEEQE